MIVAQIHIFWDSATDGEALVPDIAITGQLIPLAKIMNAWLSPIMNVINKHQTRWSSTLFENVYFSQSENRYANYQYIYPKNIIEIFVVARLTSRLLHCSME